MGTILVRDLVQQVNDHLNDSDAVEWTRAEMLVYLNSAEKDICMMDRKAFVQVSAVQLAPGTLQTVPSDGLGLFRLTRNMGVDGLTPGHIITEMPLAVMDTDETWHTSVADIVVQHFIRIPQDDSRFYVYPPVHAMTDVYAEISYPATPPEIVVTDWVAGLITINLPDIYADALFYLMVFKACDRLKNNIEGMAGKAQAALSMAVQLVTGKSSADVETRVKGSEAEPV